MVLVIEGPGASTTRSGTAASVTGSGAALTPRIRTNSRRGLTDTTRTSYPPVEAVHLLGFRVDLHADA